MDHRRHIGDGKHKTTQHEKRKDFAKNNVVVDMKNVNWMNSSGLGILIGGLTTMRNNGGDLRLANVTERIKSLLMITKLITVFDTYESLDLAVSSFT